MNHADTFALLTAIAAVDNRRIDDATVAMWHDILGDLQLADCQQAARDHFAATTDYLMPAHIRAGAIAIRNRRHEADQRHARAIEAPPARPETVRASVAAVATKLATIAPRIDPDTDRSATTRSRALARARADIANRPAKPVRLGTYAAHTAPAVDTAKCQRPDCGANYTPDDEGTRAHLRVFGHRPDAA